MKQITPNSNSRNARTLIASLLSYVLLAGQLTPLVLATNGSLHNAPAARNPSELQTIVQGAPAEPARMAPVPVPLVFVPNISATKTDGIPNATAVNPGDIITYSITITNSGTDATNVTLNDTVDPNTTIVGGSAKSTPIAFNDAYDALGNVRIQVPDGVSDLLANDVDPDTGTNAGLTITTLAGDNSAPFSGTSTQSGQVTATTGDGSFQYNPAPGFTGTDTFTYTVTDSNGGTSTATVTLTVTSTIWFVNSVAAPGGDGRLTTPFNCLVGAGCFDPVAADDPGDNIFLYSGNYTGGLTVLNNQKLIGAGASQSLATVAGVTVPTFSDPLPATGGANPTITTVAASTNGVNLAVGASNTLRGFTIGNTTGIDLSSGVNFGTLTLSEVTLNGSGRALSLTSGALAATFQSITSSSSSGGQGINLAGVTGAMTVTGGTSITNPATQCILVGTTTASINFGNTDCTGGTDGISLQNNSAGTRTFGTLSVTNNSGVAFLHAVGGGITTAGTTTITNPGGIGISIATSTTAVTFGNTNVTLSGGTGVSLTGSTAGGTVSFADLDISPDANQAGLVASSNAGTITSTSGTVVTTGASAINVTSSPLALVFDSVSASGGTTAGVSLTTATGSLVMNGGTLTGNATVAPFVVSGGTVSSTFSGGVTQANNAPMISISGGHVTGTITFQTGTLSATNGTGLQFDNADGIYNFNGTTTLNGGDAGIDIQNGSAGTFLFSTNTSITNPSGVAYREDTSTANVTYNGTITKNNNASNAVDINAKTGGTTAFSGAITASTTTANSIDLTNTGGVVNFTGGLNLTTTSGVGFNATGSGATVSATQNNTSIVNTITSTTGTALNVVNTTIGATGLTFRSISSNGGTSNGITVDTTGALGGLTITGNGAACTSVATCTGGAIQNKNGADNQSNQGIGIYLNSTQNVSLTRMSIQGHQNHGIRGSNVTGFTLDNSLVGTTAINGTSNTADTDPTGFSGEGSVRFFNLLGSATISNSTLDQGFSRTIALSNNSGTLNRLTITNCTVRQTLATATASDSFFAESTANATVNFTINSASQFTATRQFHVQTTALGTSTMDIQINSGCAFSNSIAPVPAGGGMSLSGGGTDSLVTFNIDGNSFRQGSVGAPPALNVGRLMTAGMVSGAGKFDGKFTNNTVGVTGVAFSGGGNGADGIGIFASGNKAATTRGTGTTDSRFLIQGNTFKHYGQTGVQISAVQGNSTLDATVIGNTMNEPGSAAGGAFAAIWVNAGALPPDTNTVNVAIGSATVPGNKNTMQDSDPNNATDVFLDRNSCGGCAAQLNLYRNGSGAPAGMSEAIDRQILVDDNNPTLDLLGGFTNGSGPTIGTPAAAPPQPTALIRLDDATSKATRVDTPATTTPQPEKVRTSKVDAIRSNPSNEALSLSSRPAAEVAQGSGRASSASNQLELSKSKHDGGTATRFAAKDAWLSLASQPSAAVPQKQGGTSQPKPNTITPTPPVVVGDNITWNVGTLPAGQSVTITFQVTVDNPFFGPGQVSNQGTVTADGPISVLTDDPDAAGVNNPTITLVTVPNPNINVNDAKAPEPASGSAPMLFTVSLSAPAPGAGVTVHYSTADQAPGVGHAVAGSDYTAVPDTILTFASGEQIKTVSVSILADAIVEPDETFLLNLSNATGGTIVGGPAVGTITQNVPGTFLISELRTSGPGGPGDDFVELYNNTDSPLTITASDASAGFGVFKTGVDCNATPVLIATILSGTVIPARGHYLLVGPTYGLGGYAAGDQTVADIASDSNVAVFSTANVLNLSSANRLDAVGFGTNTTGVCALLEEGTTLPAIGPSALQHSFFRDPCGKGGNSGTFGACPSNGKPVDFNNNVTDFIFADTASTPTIAGQHLGAPGPENLASPIERNSTINGLLLDATVSGAAVPNRVRNLTNSDPPNTNNGTLSIRRRFVNNTGAPITRLRFRIIDMDSTPVPGGVADVRALSSVLVVATGVMDPVTCLASTGSATVPCTVNVQGTTLEEPPAQALGGALNSSMITLGTPLANGASINLQFLLGVQTSGSFKFFVNIEALP